MPKAEIMRALTNPVEAAKSGLDRATDEQLATGSRVNNFDWTGIQAVIRSVAHFRGHTQEIIHPTRALLGDDYQYAGPK